MVLVKPERIASFMALVPLPHSFAELDSLVSHDVLQQTLKTIVDNIDLNTEKRKLLLSRIVPEATYKRRRDNLDEGQGVHQSMLHGRDGRGCCTHDNLS